MDWQEGPVTAITAEETTDKIFYGKWTANASGVPVTFVGADGSEQTETCEVLTTETTTLADGGWYVVNTALNYGSYNGLTVSGTTSPAHHKVRRRSCIMVAKCKSKTHFPLDFSAGL